MAVLALTHLPPVKFPPLVIVELAPPPNSVGTNVTPLEELFPKSQNAQPGMFSPSDDVFGKRQRQTVPQMMFNDDRVSREFHWYSM